MRQLIAQGLARASDTRVVEVGRGLLEDSGAILARALLDGSRPALVVADERTFAAAGAAVVESLRRAGQPLAEPLVFPGRPALYASHDQAETVQRRLADDRAVGVAVGSGTINDLVKLASGQLGRPYAVVGTAASMDGYAGFGAPISRDGVKLTLPCPAPAVVLFDLDVAAAAPPAMVASGFGDLAAKIPGGADWILADAVGVEAIDPTAWELVQTGVGRALSQPAALAAGQPEAYEALVQGLILSGLAMQVYRGTRPASGAEHYFSHLWELSHLGQDQDPPLSHGFKVAIGSLAMCAFYERFLARRPGPGDVRAAVAAWPEWDQVTADVRRLFSGPLADNAVRETKIKRVDQDGLRQRLERLVQGWDDTQSRLRAQLTPARRLQDQLRAAGAPTGPDQIGLSLDALRQTFPRAMYYRSRYTVLDLARELGWFEQLTEEVFAPGGLWT
ncbi:MAG: sn-glycerol-1-phosphate dehydrogenase [Propionibacteriaceae bacterium]|jgi:glycerol-1-phosphate dehydrogenase [NAD(P)+]|nr:sn-glycerol-1-phosphate dehydrogenase [Propionibacteriaceae bacterium]